MKSFDDWFMNTELYTCGTLEDEEKYRIGWDAANEAATEQSEPRWINVDESLPGEGSGYLVVKYSSRLLSLPYESIGVDSYDVRNGCFRNYPNATHWIELPK
jgi:hypothetical protein